MYIPVYSTRLLIHPNYTRKKKPLWKQSLIHDTKGSFTLTPCIILSRVPFRVRSWHVGDIKFWSKGSTGWPLAETLVCIAYHCERERAQEWDTALCDNQSLNELCSVSPASTLCLRQWLTYQRDTHSITSLFSWLLNLSEKLNLWLVYQGKFGWHKGFSFSKIWFNEVWLIGGCWCQINYITRQNHPYLWKLLGNLFIDVLACFTFIRWRTILKLILYLFYVINLIYCISYRWSNYRYMYCLMCSVVAWYGF